MTPELPSWNDTPTRQAIVEFVERVTREGGPDHVPPSERVAVFDNDGTLWCEKPMPIQLDFLIRRFAALAADDPALLRRQPYAAAAGRDFDWFARAIVHHYQGDDADLDLLMDAVSHAFVDVRVDDYAGRVGAFFTNVSHPVLNRSYLTCGYQPMIELMRYLESNGFATYIASASDRDFMRPAAQAMYAIPPERVIGSAVEVAYADSGHKPGILYKDRVEFFDDGPTKPERIWSRIGRRPTIAVGNSDGDLPMLRFAGQGDGPALRILLNHDDNDREFAYTTGAEQAMDEARTNRWTVVNMAHDWTTVFAD
jgi:phosphoserine phosphatase